MSLARDEAMWTRLAARVAELRERDGLTVEELGAACGLSRGTIINFESGRQRLTLESLLKVARALCVTVDDLLAGEQWDAEHDPEMAAVAQARVELRPSLEGGFMEMHPRHYPALLSAVGLYKHLGVTFEIDWAERPPVIRWKLTE